MAGIEEQTWKIGLEDMGGGGLLPIDLGVGDGGGITIQLTERGIKIRGEEVGRERVPREGVEDGRRRATTKEGSEGHGDGRYVYSVV